MSVIFPLRANIDIVGRPGGASLPTKQIASEVDRPLRGRCYANAASPPLLTSSAERSIHLAFAALVFLAINLQAAEVIPPKPAGYFNDYASVVSKEAALRFNEQLAQFERDTSNQVLVAVFPKMQSDSDVADYTQRVAQSWGVGQEDRRNGAVLFVFIEDRKMFVQVGYGLEGALPDATAFDITEYQIKPRFRNNDYEGGLAAGIDSILQAIRGEYKGSGTTVRERQTEKNAGFGGFIFLIIFVIVMISIFRTRKRGYRYSSSGGPNGGWWSGGSGGGWSSGSSGGGFSGFSGGGGSFGGGGAGSSW